MTRVVFVVIDALPVDLVGTAHTPNLARLAAGGGTNPRGGRAVLTTATYPNHATFATGLAPVAHGILVNRVWNGTEFRPASEIGPRGDTIFNAARRVGRSSAIAVGDHHLIGVMGGLDADRHWPPHGRRPEVELDEFRYATNAAVLDAIDETGLVDADLGVVHFNEPDTVSHRFGPGSAELADCARRTDAALGELLARLQPRWDDTVVMVVSDHDQEQVTAHGVDLQAELEANALPGTVETEGTAALVMHGPPVDHLLQLDCVEGAHMIDDVNTIVWGAPGVVFGLWLDELHGSHGSPRCDRQVAVIGGGAPAVAPLAEALREIRPDATWWAPTIIDLLGAASTPHQ
jgi:hypothetical protein